VLGVCEYLPTVVSMCQCVHMCVCACVCMHARMGGKRERRLDRKELGQEIGPQFPRPLAICKKT